MTSREFCYWLQGWFELNETLEVGKGASPATMAVIQKHLNMVFTHEIDPSYGDENHQKVLNDIHNQETLNIMHDKINDLSQGGPLMRC